MKKPIVYFWLFIFSCKKEANQTLLPHCRSQYLTQVGCQLPSSSVQCKYPAVSSSPDHECPLNLVERYTCMSRQKLTRWVPGCDLEHLPAAHLTPAEKTKCDERYPCTVSFWRGFLNSPPTVELFECLLGPHQIYFGL